MKKIKIEIMKWESLANTYSLSIDGQETLEVPHGDLRIIVYEIEKYLRLRFKEDLRKQKTYAKRTKGEGGGK